MSTAMTKARWWHLPAFSLFLGVLCLGAIWIGGDPVGGVLAFGVMAVAAALLALGGRSEMVRGLRGDGRDEYWQRMDARATYFSGMTAITLIIVMCLWEWRHGRDGTPYVQLGAIAGVAYMAALGFLRWRG